MFSYSHFLRDFRLEHEVTWQRIYDRHRANISTARVKVALPNLERIITATLQISNRSSFDSMSLRDLSSETGLSMGALYSYIDSKDQLSAMILEHVLYLVETVLAPPPTMAGRERLRWLLRTHVYLTEAMQPWFFFAYMEAKTFDSRVRRMAINSELRTERLLAECLAAGQAAGSFATADSTMTASLIKPLLQDWYLKRWKYRRREVDPDSYADRVIHFVEATLPVPDRCSAGEPEAFGEAFS